MQSSKKEWVMPPNELPQRVTVFSMQNTRASYMPFLQKRIGWLRIPVKIVPCGPWACSRGLLTGPAWFRA